MLAARLLMPHVAHVLTSSNIVGKSHEHLLACSDSGMNLRHEEYLVSWAGS